MVTVNKIVDARRTQIGFALVVVFGLGIALFFAIRYMLGRGDSSDKPKRAGTIVYTGRYEEKMKTRYRPASMKMKRMEKMDVTDSQFANGKPDMPYKSSVTSPELRSLYIGPGEFVSIPDRQRVMATPEGSAFLWVRLEQERQVTLISMGNERRESFCFRASPKVDEATGSHNTRIILEIFDRRGMRVREIYTDDANIMDNQWHLVGFTVGRADRDARTRGVHIYVDGAETETKGAQNGILLSPPDGEEEIMSLMVGNDSMVKYTSVAPIYASNLTYWNKPLTPIQASAMYDSGSQELTNPLNLIADGGETLVGWWLLSDSSGATVVDSRGTSTGQVIRQGRWKGKPRVGVEVNLNLDKEKLATDAGPVDVEDVAEAAQLNQLRKIKTTFVY